MTDKPQYRVVRKYLGRVEVFAIHEVTHVAESGKVHLRIIAASPSATSVDELREKVHAMQDALKLPTIDP